MSASARGNQSAKGAARSPSLRLHLKETSTGNKNRVGRKSTPETRERVRAAVLKQWANPEFKARMVQNHLSKIQRPTSIEIILGKMLADAFPNEQCEREYAVGPYRIDWAIPSLMLAYEADGVYWHSLPGRCETDAAKDTYLGDLGWAVIRFTEQELRRG